MIDLIVIPIIILLAIIIMIFSLRKKMVNKDCGCSGKSKKFCCKKRKN